MKILFICPRVPYPLDSGGKIRTYHIFTQLAEKNNMTLVCFYEDEVELVGLQEINKYTNDTHIIKRHTKKNTIGLIRNLISNLPFPVENYASKEMKNLVKRLLKENKYDLVHIEGINMAQYIHDVYSVNKNIYTVLNEHNVEYILLERAYRNYTNVYKKLYFYIQKEKLKRYEQKTCPIFDLCLVCSKEDKHSLTKLSPKSVVDIIENGVNLDYYDHLEKHSEKGQKYNLLFIGSMDYFPNEDAVMFFCNEIFPKLSEINANFKFYIVGKNPSESIRQLSNIEVTGRVNDVRDFLRIADLLVVPLRIGGGTRLKILEGLAAKIPIISTEIGAEGLGLINNEHIVIANTVNEFIDGIIDLSMDSDKVNNIVKNGYEFAKKIYSWNVIGNKLNNKYKELVKMNKEYYS